MNVRIRSVAATVVATVSVLGLTAVPTFADDGGDGGNGGQWGYGWGQSQSSWPGDSQGNGNPAAVTLSSGWNLVDEGVLGELYLQGAKVYSYYWNGQSYQSTADSTADGVWVYLSGGATVPMLPSSAADETVSIAPRTWGMIGDPYSMPVSVTLQPGDVAYTYDPVSGQYSQAIRDTLTLQPGQGAWLFSASGSTYAIGVQPPSLPGGGAGGTVTGAVYGNSQ